MNDEELIGKLSRIFETHSLHRGEHDWELEDLLEDLAHEEDLDLDAPALSLRSPYNKTQQATATTMMQRSMNRNSSENDFFADFPGGLGASLSSPRSPQRMMTTPTLNIDRPKPVEVWEKKIATQRGRVREKKTPKLTSEEWQRLAEKMHQSNRVKQSAMIKEQNQGLALELGGYLFKPRINKTSLDLSATMKSLQERMPEMLAEKKKELEHKQKEAALAEVADCSFTPVRNGAKTSDQYLQKIGRTRPAKPTDFYKYEEERKRRIAVRQQIVAEVESKELTFKPQLGEKSLRLQERLLNKGAMQRDPVTRTSVPALESTLADATLLRSGRTTSALPFNISSSISLNASADGSLPLPPEVVEGPLLVIESEHPYRHNCDEYTTVCIPGAVAYKLSFAEETKTEPVYDFIKFFHDETRTDYFGASKYSGGMNGSPANWPGIGPRPPLIIPSPKFVLHFHSNGSLNDYGFRLLVTPLLLSVSLSASAGEGSAEKESNVPQISSLGQKYQPKDRDRVHERLYKHGVSKKVQEHNNLVDMMQSKLNISLKPWEMSRGAQGSQLISPLYSKTQQTQKAPLADYIEDMLLDEEVVVCENERERARDSSAGGERALYTRDLAHRERARKNKSSLCVVEFDDSLGSLWKQLRTM